MARYLTHRSDATQPALVAWLEARGCLYEHLGQPVDGILCVPVRGGWRTVPVEFKTGRGKLRPAQVRFMGRWHAPAYVLRTEPECAAMLAELGCSVSGVETTTRRRGKVPRRSTETKKRV